MAHDGRLQATRVVEAVRLLAPEQREALLDVLAPPLRKELEYLLGGSPGVDFLNTASGR
jgi:hypothetical protein